MRELKISLPFFILFHSFLGYSQNLHKIDSLNQLFYAAAQDSNKVIILSHLSDEYAIFNSDKAFNYADLGLSIAKQLNYKNGIATCLNKMGVVYYSKGKYKDAIECYLQALKINEEKGNKTAVADNLSNIGAVFRIQGDYEKALKYSLQALKLDEELQNKSAIAGSNTNIGNIYFDSENYPKALKYYQLALNDFTKLSDKQNIATVLNNIGALYTNKEDYSKAIENFNLAIKTFEAYGDKEGVASNWVNIGQVYYMQNNFKLSKEFYNKSLMLANEIGSKNIMKYCYANLSELAENQKDYKAAFDYHKLYSDIKDTLINAEIKKQIDEISIKYETEKKEKENTQLKEESIKQEIQNKRQQKRLNFMLFGLVLIAGTGFIFFVRSRARQKTNKFLQDLVDLKTQEENELRKAKNAVEQSMRLKEQFLANISHEIRTPLNAIVGFTDVLYEGNLGPNEKEYIHFIKTAGENLVNIVNDILDMSKIEAGKIQFEDKQINVFEFIKSLQILFEHKAKEKHIELLFNCGDSVPKMVTGDPTRLTQIFINLIGNALKFTEKGSIIINVELLKESSDNVVLEFSVKDTGIGIPKEKLEFIFERFIQVEANTTRKYGGTGLGLSIVKHLVELQNGSISVSSEPGVGSEFTFNITFKHAKKVNSKAEKFLNEKQHLKNLKILLVEDNILNTKLIMALFKNTGIKIDSTENGKEAIEQLVKEKYDLILMDMQMPVMDGYQATVHIRQELKNDIPIIAITAHAMTGEKEKCLALGMNDFIAKPINAEVLFEKINNLVPQ